MSKTIKLSNFEYEQLIAILEKQDRPFDYSVTHQIGVAWIKKLVAKLKALADHHE